MSASSRGPTPSPALLLLALCVVIATAGVPLEAAQAAAAVETAGILNAAGVAESHPFALLAVTGGLEYIERPIRRHALVFFLSAFSLMILAGAGLALLWRQQRQHLVQQQRKAELERKALEDHYGYLKRYSNDIMLLADSSGRIRETNERASAAYGFTIQEFRQMQVRDLVDPVSAATYDARSSGIGTDDGSVFETRHRRKDGTTFPVEVSTRAIQVEGVEYRQSVIRDITERKAMEAKLLEANQRLEAIIEAAPVGILAFDRQGRIRLWNEAAERITGWTAEEVLGQTPPSSFYPAGEREAELTRWQDLSAGKLVAACETKRVRKDGSIAEVAVTTAPLFDASGAPAGCILAVADVSDRKRALEELQESKQRMQLAVQASQTGLWDLDLVTNRVYYSPEWKAQLGYAPDEISDNILEWESRLHPDDRERSLATERAYLANPSGHLESEFRLRHKDGSYRWIFSRGALFRGEDGKSRRLTGCHVDITQRKRTLEELERNTHLVQRVLDATPDLIYIYDLHERRNAFTNRQITELLGYTAEQVRAFPNLMNAILHPDDAAVVAEHHRRCLTAADGETLEVEYRMRHSRGEWRWLRSRDTPFTRAVDGSTRQILGLAQDVTARRQAIEALRASEARLERAQRLAALGNWEGPAEGGERHWSDEMYRIFGVSQDAFIPSRDAIVACVAPEDRDRVSTVVRENLIRQTPYEVEYRILRPDGSERHLRERGEFEPDHTAGLRLIGTIQDVTEYKRLQDRFLQAQRLESIGRLAGGVAHDFNNLLTVIIGYGDLMLSRLEAENPSVPPLGEIRNAAMRAAALTEQLLAFSRRQVVQPKVLSLNAIIRDTEKMLSRLIGEDVRLITDLDPELGPVVADPSQINQVLMNLAVNARDAMPHGGSLILETRNVQFDEGAGRAHPELQPGLYVSLVVKDTGVGMDEQTRSRLFEPFFTTKEKGKGTGLGLSTVYGIVTQAGGHIFVQSEPEEGAVFQIFLPRADKPLSSSQDAAQPTAELRGSETILVVEDQEDVRRLARETLEGYGYNVLEAANGAEAIEIADKRAGRIDLTLTDVVMPGMTGRELAGQIERVRPGMKVLYMSGYTDNAIVHQGALDPKVAYVQKPFSPRALAAKIRETLGAPAQ